ncbi:MAG: hypothetical protein RQ885_00710 [Desulfurococcales archaeon]|jgi:hypothetical protein|nr:hypothetical protein [Desulfurococcales archaeon]
MGKDKCFLQDIMGASISSLEYVPLTLYKPYGLSLILWIWSGDLGIEGCRECPWSEAYGSKSSLDLVEVSIDKILERGKDLKIDLIFLHGGEPIYKQWFRCFADLLVRGGIGLGVKARLDAISRYGANGLSEVKGLGAVLIELLFRFSEEIDKLLPSILEKLLSRNTYVEILVTDLFSPLERDIKAQIKNLLERYRIIVKDIYTSRPIPLGVYAANLSEQDLLSIRKIIRDSCDKNIICYIIESNRRIYPDHINCPTCGIEVAKRSDILVIPTISSNVCPSCGTEIFVYRPLKIKKRIPVHTYIHL